MHKNGIAESGDDLTTFLKISQWFQTLIYPALMERRINNQIIITNAQRQIKELAIVKTRMSFCFRLLPHSATISLYI